MRCSLLAILFTLALAAAAYGLDYAPQLDREYTDRLIAMEESAPAHVALAEWCAKVGLDDKATRHWKEALHRDPHNADARAALGYVRRGDEWVEAGDAVSVPAVGIQRYTPPAVDARRRDLEQRIQGVYTQYLSALDPATWQKGADEMLLVRDPLAAEPVHRILSNGNEKTRLLMCEVLGQLPGKEAAHRLVRVVLSDSSRAVYDAAVAAIEMRSDDHAVPSMLNGLNGSEETLQRAAHALGELRVWKAAPRLVGRLETREPRTKEFKEKGSPGAYFFSGDIVTYIADVEPVVAPGAVAFNPIIGAIPSGAGVDVDNPVVTVRKTVIVTVRQPEVLEALKKITGRDFGYDEVAWRGWLRQREAGSDRNE